jgi:gamma-glutamyltranspeptidase
MSTRAFGTEQTHRNPYFPRLLGTHGAVATHHYLSAQAARRTKARRGHDLEVAPPWTEGHLLATAIDPETGLLEAGCDPRGEKSEVFPAFALAW